MTTQSKSQARQSAPSLFGKEFGDAGNRLFDSALPEDQSLKRSLAPWVAKTALWNHLQRSAGRQTTPGPINAVQDARLNAAKSKLAARDKGQRFSFPVEGYRKVMSDRILGKHGDAYRQGFADPNRPVRDWDAQKVSPKYFNPKTGRYDLLPGVK